MDWNYINCVLDSSSWGLKLYKSVGVGTVSTEIGTIVTWDCKYMIMIRTISNKISLLIRTCTILGFRIIEELNIRGPGSSSFSSYETSGGWGGEEG